MARRPSGLRIDNPAFALVQALISYWGITNIDGGAGGADLQCADLANQPDFDGNQVVIISGPYGGQARDINGTTLLGTVTPASNFGGVITANTIFAILPIRTVPAEVAALTALVVALIADIEGATGIFHEQADEGFSLGITAAETFIVTLNAADTRYILRDLRIKSDDPTLANTITVKLYTLLNSIEVNVNSFIITNANFGTYFTLVDMFGVPHVAGDSIKVSL
ncbi:unnamed protein product, partial [marine sediment metagenome]